LKIRQAASSDVQAMVQLATTKREQYRTHAPTFHRPATNATEVQVSWFGELIEDDNVATFEHEDDAGAVDRFIVANLVPAPAVYDPGGLTCLVDDFMVADASQWGTLGRDLLHSAQQWAEPRGAVQMVVVCGPHDQPKRGLLLGFGLSVVSEWFTRQFGNDSMDQYDRMGDDYIRDNESSPTNEYYERPAIRALIGNPDGLRVLDVDAGPES
jgi:GNAT superfamily N-acetyltransferase